MATCLLLQASANLANVARCREERSPMLVTFGGKRMNQEKQFVVLEDSIIECLSIVEAVDKPTS